MTPRPSPDPGIGRRIRALRLQRGWSIRFAASRAGVSHATWSRIERGLQAADNRFTLAAVAEALERSPADLAGARVPAADPQVLAALAGADAVRRALIDIDLSEPADGIAPPLDDLARSVDLAESLLQACDYAGATRILPGLLRDLHVETAGPHAGRALGLLCLAAAVAASVLRSLHLPADSWLAAERCREAAELSGDPVLRGYAAFSRASTATVAGSHQRGLTLAERAAGELQRHLGRPGGAEVLGLPAAGVRAGQPGWRAARREPGLVGRGGRAGPAYGGDDDPGPLFRTGERRSVADQHRGGGGGSRPRG